jgi:hypothetical protein
MLPVAKWPCSQVPILQFHKHADKNTGVGKHRRMGSQLGLPPLRAGPWPWACDPYDQGLKKIIPAVESLCIRVRPEPSSSPRARLHGHSGDFAFVAMLRILGSEPQGPHGVSYYLAVSRIRRRFISSPRLRWAPAGRLEMLVHSSSERKRIAGFAAIERGREAETSAGVQVLVFFQFHLYCTS